ncbi:hypothetical protein TRFO_20901 [Tritrichomonas foetus]|uniref:Right handed beta helix domain-containing protein n=1 Tax=Tritrichomonas foetus TaxID=1144522 RepID=A0A1J4KGD6_9EUKA|nr:hypothetical protein TRFO_20901 [Tritrichomonas foetus]|eukprot:OHT10000.1 hypothetical protein TRFO_20901 [Tritrichomonas foetus]
MVNLSLIYFISLNNALNSPFLITTADNSRLNMFRCSYFRHFQSINYISEFPSHFFYSVNDSKFRSILNSAIKIKSESQIYQKQSFNHQFEIIDFKQYELTNSEFHNCKGFKGGAVHSEVNYLTISHCIFSNNSGNYGAAVYAGNIEKGHLKDSLFTNNYAKNLCAGYFLDSLSNSKNVILIDSNNFTYQTAVCVGAIECWGGVPNIKFCFIDHCNSSFGQPAVRTSTVKKTALLEFVKFSNCSSRQYGAVFQSFIYYSAALLKNCIMIDNWCLGESGTTVFIQNTNVKVTLENCIIYGKQERQFGGIKKMEKINLKNTTFIYDPVKDGMKDTPAPTRSPHPKH